MEEVKMLFKFYESISSDPTIRPTHVSIYGALLHLYNLNGFRNPVNIYRKEVMRLAKISGFATFHKCITYLKLLGYVEYLPSYEPSIPSKVHLTNLP